jgi:catechol 2,3-dioxygenase-like lactoylglutathione lyase family enzyme
MSTSWMTRRGALAVLGAVALPRARAEGILRATRVDHAALDVGDLDQALAYYRRLFGNEVLKDAKTPRRYLRLGPCYLAIAPAASGQAPHINHFAVGIENFNAAPMKSTLEGAGIKVRESDVGLFVTDPDGISIQIWADQSWKLLRNAAPEKFPKQEALFHAVGMHHIAVQSGDLSKSVEFYGKLFGKPIYDPPGNPQPLFLAGDTRLRIYLPDPNKPPKIDHFSALVDKFDAPAAVKVVKDLGAKAELSRQGTLNEFFDPQGIRMQVTFVGQPTGAATTKK